jgi:hypothetical protein
MNQQNEDFFEDEDDKDEAFEEAMEKIKNDARRCRFGFSHRVGLECCAVMEFRRRGNLLGPHMTVEQTKEMAAAVPRCLVLHGHLGDVVIARAIMEAAEQGVPVAEVWFRNTDAGDAA